MISRTGRLRAPVWAVGVAIALALSSTEPASAADAAGDLVIRGGRVIDPEPGLDAIRNVRVRDGRIVAVTDQPVQAGTVIDASGWWSHRDS